jgi:hypothetical protein
MASPGGLRSEQRSPGGIRARSSTPTTAKPAVVGGPNHAGDSVLFHRHDKRPRLDPFCINLSGNYEKERSPTAIFGGKNCNKFRTVEVYITSVVPPWTTKMMPSRLPHLGQMKVFEPTHPATAMLNSGAASSFKRTPPRLRHHRGPGLPTSQRRRQDMFRA